MSIDKNILLIDNNKNYLDTVSEWLSINGYSVFPAISIDDAKQIFETISIQLIITDIRVDDDGDVYDRSGLYFAQSIAQTIPKVLMTSYPSYDIIKKAFTHDYVDDAIGIVDFVDKAEGLKVLQNTIDTIFERYVLSNYPQFKVGGALTDDDAAIYITRQAEREIINGLSKMEYLLIIEPRQQGKTSLINFLIRYPEAHKPILIYIDISAIDRATQERFYGSLYARLVEQLDGIYINQINIAAPINHVQWRSLLSSLAHIIKAKQTKLVISLDEIGTPMPDAIGFFSVLRDLYNSRQAEPHLKCLTFILVGAFNPRDLIDDLQISPFNVAKRIRLPDFTLQQVWGLISTFPTTKNQVDLIAARIYYWTDGQPYLTQRICSYIKSDSSLIDIDGAIDRFRREDDNHIPQLLNHIRCNDPLRLYLRRILAGEKIKFYPSENQYQSQLEILGIIKADNNGYCVIRNRIYIQSLLSSNLFGEEISSDDMLENQTNTEENVQESMISEGNSITTILFLAADPTNESRLRLGEELREIQDKLQMSELRDKYILKQRMSVRPIDITQAILIEKPQIVHFSGHGTNNGELCFEDEYGKSKTVEPDALGALFKLISSQVECVLLNACYSAIQANSISKHINYVIGMSKEIGDKAAITFSVGFYQALGAGKSIEESYKFGCVQIQLSGIPEHLTPVLDINKLL